MILKLPTSSGLASSRPAAIHGDTASGGLVLEVKASGGIVLEVGATAAVVHDVGATAAVVLEVGASAKYSGGVTRGTSAAGDVVLLELSP